MQALSTTMRFGRDDKLVRVLGCWCPNGFCHPDRSEVKEGPAVSFLLPQYQCAAKRDNHLVRGIARLTVCAGECRWTGSGVPLVSA